MRTTLATLLASSVTDVQQFNSENIDGQQYMKWVDDYQVTTTLPDILNYSSPNVFDRCKANIVCSAWFICCSTLPLKNYFCSDMWPRPCNFFFLQSFSLVTMLCKCFLGPWDLICANVFFCWSGVQPYLLKEVLLTSNRSHYLRLCLLVSRPCVYRAFSCANRNRKGRVRVRDHKIKSSKWKRCSASLVYFDDSCWVIIPTRYFSSITLCKDSMSLQQSFQKP